MAKPAVRVRDLGKMYCIQSNRQSYNRLAEELGEFVVTSCGRLLGRSSQPKQDEVLWALRNLSFDINHGDVVGLVGRNGAGKSTLLKILSRITDPTDGRCEIFGRVGALLEVGVGFHPELSGRENIFLSGAVLGMKQAEIKRNFDAIVDFAGIERFIDMPVKRYSSGMYVRLAFAVAAHLQSEILIVDEVLAVGDTAFQSKCLGKMSDVSRSGRTVIFVSHNLSAISALCNRAMYLSDGTLKSDGAPQAIIAEYMSEMFDKRATDLHSFRQSDTGKEVCIQRLELTNADGLTAGDPLEFIVELSASKYVDDLNIVATLVDSMGQVVGTFCTAETFTVAPGAHTMVVVEVKNLHLVPGQYTTVFRVGKQGIHERTDYDVIHGRPWLQVLPIVEDGSPLVRWNSASWGSTLIRDAHIVHCETGSISLAASSNNTGCD